MLLLCYFVKLGWMMNLGKRAQAFLALSRYTGVEVTSQFLKKTSEHFPQAGIPLIHNIVEGIYKPAGDQYAFSIYSASAAGHNREIYPDEYQIQPDGSWTMLYSAKVGRLDSAINKSLFACMKDSVPLLVIVKTKPKETPGGARYTLLGPAFVENFDPTSRRFLLRGCSDFASTQIAQQYDKGQIARLSLRSELILPFQVKETRPQYQIMKQARGEAFRNGILDEYRCLCAVCQSRFLLKQEGKMPLIEAEAAHIIPVEAEGPDDLRNGISFFKRHHWAFDNGLFTVTDGRAVKVSPAVLRAERRRFDLEEYDGELLVPPTSDACRPHEEALHWHQVNRFRL
jgi:hypothetical protein